SGRNFASLSLIISFSLCQRVSRQIYFLRLGLADMSVNLGGSQTGMPQQFLHHPQVRAAIQQMGGKSMSDGMRMHFFINPALFGVLMNDFLDTSFNQLFAVAVDKNGLGLLFPQ